MSKLLEKLRKVTTLDAELLQNSKYFNTETVYPTRIPLLNLALTGRFDGGLMDGITMLAAPPKHFKTFFMLEGIRAFQEANKDEDYMVVFYDNEKGATPAYFDKVGIDKSRVDHRPFMSIEDLKFDLVALCDAVTAKDKIMVCIDSLGNAASKKEVEDALSAKSVQDMTRAKAIKSLFRIITPHVVFKGFPMIVVNHSYQSQDLFPVEVAGGGRGAQYAGHTLIFIGKSQEKDGDEIVGNKFPLRIGLSRFVREKSSFPISVTWEDGINTYSGLTDFAEELGLIKSAGKGVYFYKGDETKKVRMSTIEEDTAYLDSLLKNDEFKKAIEAKYRL